MGVIRAATTALLSTVLLLAGGCAVTQETRQSLGGYVQAMEQVHQSADLFVADFSNGLKVQEDLIRTAGAVPATRRAEYPTEFKLPTDAGMPQTDADKAVAATRQALAVVRDYNAALVALAEGQSEQEVRQRTTALGGALQTLASLAKETIPGLSLVTGIGSKILKLAQDASNRQQLQQAVAEGREPVGEILAVLEKQTPAMYRLSVVGASQGQDRARDSISRSAAALRTFLERRGPPTDPGLAGQMMDVQVRLGDIGTRTRTLPRMPIPMPFSGGKPAYDAAAHTETQVLLQSMEASADKYAEVVAKQNAYHELMASYVAALRQARHGLDLVAESLKRPVDLRTEVLNLLQVAFELRDAMAAYRNPPTNTASP